MIDKEYGKYKLICDCCGENDKELIFDTFQEAVDYKNDFNWLSMKIGEDWFNYCQSCKESQGDING